MTQRALFALVIVLSTMLPLSGCRGQSTGNPEEPDLLSTLPTDWIVVPINGNIWTQVNIDDDEGQVEYLLLYTYNNQNPDGTTASGPAGSSIFDLQNNSELVPKARVVSMPYQPSGTYVPYRILPNYWQGSDTGFIAPTGRQGNVTVNEITRDQERQAIVSAETTSISTPSSESTSDGDTTIELEVETRPVQVKELLVEDGGQTITVVWWRNLIDGYGVANAHAAAGFGEKTYERGDQADSPLTSFIGLHPFHDRSELCYVTLFEREYMTETVILDLEPTTMTSVDFVFSESPRGIDFCKNPPATPFYPEAVVLKYLYDSKSEGELLDLDEVNEREVATPLTTAFRGENSDLRIEGLYGPHLIRFDNVDNSPATVCLALIDQATGKQSAFRFRLNHVKPDVEARTTDQFKIVNIQPIPAPPGGPAVDCNDIVENGTPGRIPTP